MTNATTTPEQLAKHQRMWNELRAIAIEKRSIGLNGEKCFACFIDIDGFKDQIERDPAALYRTILNLKIKIDAIVLGGGVSLDADGTCSRDIFSKLLPAYSFSDSWVFVSVDNSVESFAQISSVAARAFARLAMSDLTGRGGIAEGEMWVNSERQIVFGTALVKAYKLAESIDCFGVAISPEIQISNASLATKILTVPARSKSCTASDSGRHRLRFASHDAYLFEYESVCTSESGYLQHFKTLIESYKKLPTACGRVLNRYNQSIEVVSEMFFTSS